jgi:hypothetical protein
MTLKKWILLLVALVELLESFGLIKHRAEE